MATDIATFRVRFPEFNDNTEFPDARIQLFLDDATLYMGTDESHWRGKYDTPQAYLAAHLLTLGTNSEAGDNSSQSGSITSKSAGGVSVSMSSPTISRSEIDSYLATTVYGQQYMNIRNLCFPGVSVA